MNDILFLAQQSSPGVTLTPALLALGALLIGALGALLGGGVAWGRFAATLEQLRADHADLRAEVRKGQADGAQIAVLSQRLSDQDAEVKRLRTTAHDLGTAVATLRAHHDALASRVGHLADDVRASHHPPPPR
jgi:outer membrane murein-binding lipoprotein Lpp